MDPKLSPNVQMQFMRPGQLEAAARRFPVVYVPFGLIEWHGRHLSRVVKLLIGLTRIGG